MDKQMFTLAEYVEANDLKVDMRDSFATKMVARHLRNLGYLPKRTRDATGKAVTLWTKNNREKELKELAAKLNRLEGRP